MLVRTQDFPKTLEVKPTSPDGKKSLDTSSSTTASVPSIEIKSSPIKDKQKLDSKINFSKSCEAVKKIESIYIQYNALKEEYLASPNKDQLKKCRKMLNKLRKAAEKLCYPEDSALDAVKEFILLEKINNKELEYRAKLEKHGIKPTPKILKQQRANLDKLKKRNADLDSLYTARKEEKPKNLQDMVHFEKKERALIEAAIEAPWLNLDEVVVKHKLYDHASFFKKQNRKTIKSIIIESKTVYPYHYHNADNKGRNPTYQNIVGRQPSLKLNEKRIWVLRGDFQLATGIKFFYRGEERVGRYGHPSLSDNGPVYYSGWMAQRSDHIEMLLHSGRFHRKLYGVNEECMEIYIAKILMDAYGRQSIVFNEVYYEDHLYHHFEYDYPTPQRPERRDRVYTPEFIDRIIEADKFVDITHEVLWTVERATNHTVRPTMR